MPLFSCPSFVAALAFYDILSGRLELSGDADEKISSPVCVFKSFSNESRRIRECRWN